MTSGLPRHTKRFAFSLLLALAATTPAPQAAAPTDLFFSEYIEGSSNNKALEIYNGTGSAVSLAGYSVQMYFNGAASPSTTIALSGSMASGDVFVLAQASATVAILAQADQTSSASWYNGNDVVVLLKGTTVIDVIGQIGNNPGTEWGSGLASTADNTLQRKAAVCLGDDSGADEFLPATQWEGLATDTFSGLGSHTTDCSSVDTPPSISSILPSHGTSDVLWDANITVVFSEPVTLSASAIALSCVTSGAHPANVTGGPTTFVIDPNVDFVRGEQCTLLISAAGVHDQDVNDPPDQMAADVSSSFTTLNVDPCTLGYTPISAIQGSGAAAAITGIVTTRGVVVGDFEVPGTGSGQIRGFFIQDPAGDGNPATSDGIFVFRGGVGDVQLGDLVRVTGTAGEFQNQTQLSAVTSVFRCGTGTVTPTDVTLPFATVDAAERNEGMLVRLPQTLTVTEHFQLGRFGQVVVSSGGRLQQPTDVLAPGTAANALQTANNLNRLIIDDGSNIENPDPIVFGRGGLPLSAANTLRGGDTATGIVGVMTYTWAGNNASGNAYRVRPVGALNGFVSFAPSNPRPLAVPARPAKALRIAGMNLLNFFNTFDGCRGGIVGAPIDCRGAENQLEFDRQWPKTVAAVLGTQADVIGVLEIENDGYGPDSSLQFLVDRLNETSTSGTFAFIDVDSATATADTMGTDAIKVALLYRSDRVMPVGATAALNSVEFVNGGDGDPRNRPALAQAFEELSSGGRLIVSVNHLKSKGSECDLPDAGDGQGNCNQVRRNAAALLAQWLATDPTGTSDPDVLIIGDLNSYSMEQPITDLVAAGYTRLVPAFSGGHSYAFDGQWGSLDHALASASLRAQVVGAADWAINADEPGVLDYNTNFKSPAQVTGLYAPDWFRVSDHNPLLVDAVLDVASDAGAKLTGGGGLVLRDSIGTLDATGYAATFSLNAKMKKGQPEGHINITLSGAGGRRRYQIRTTKLAAILREATGQHTVLAKIEIIDVSTPSSPVVIGGQATLRFTVEDNGEPGVGHDSVALAIWTADGRLWLASGWQDGLAVGHTITEGNVQSH